MFKVNQTDKRGKTALHKAAKEGHRIITELLLSHPAVAINAQDSLGQTALHIAVKEVNMNVVRRLLQEDKIYINIRDDFGNCAISVASKSGFLQIFDLLKFGKPK